MISEAYNAGMNCAIEDLEKFAQPNRFILQQDTEDQDYVPYSAAGGGVMGALAGGTILSTIGADIDNGISKKKGLAGALLGGSLGALGANYMAKREKEKDRKRWGTK